MPLKLTINVAEPVLDYDGVTTGPMPVPPSEPGQPMTHRPTTYRDIMVRAIDGYSADLKPDEKYHYFNLGVEMWVGDEVSLDVSEWDMILKACSVPPTGTVSYGRIRQLIEAKKEEAQRAIDSAAVAAREAAKQDVEEPAPNGDSAEVHAEA